MAHYSIFIGDNKVVDVYYKAEIPQALSKHEQEEIKAKARKTYLFQQFDNYVGFGFLTIKLNL